MDTPEVKVTVAFEFSTPNAAQAAAGIKALGDLVEVIRTAPQDLMYDGRSVDRAALDLIQTAEISGCSNLDEQHAHVPAVPRI